MALDPIASRYAQAAFDTAKAEGMVDAVLEELAFLGEVFHDQPEFRQFLWNPDVDPDQKLALLDRLYRGSWSSLVKGLVQMAISFGRAKRLDDVRQIFHAAEADGHLHEPLHQRRPAPAIQPVKESQLLVRVYIRVPQKLAELRLVVEHPPEKCQLLKHRVDRVFRLRGFKRGLGVA